MLAFWVKIPLIPSLPFLKLDISDVPVLIATLLSGYSSGVSILFAVSFLRFILFSSAGFMGLVVRLTSIFLIFSVYYFKKLNTNIIYRVFILSLGMLVCICVKLPINYLGWIYIYGIPKQVVKELMIPYIIPFNILKITLNCMLAILLFKPFKKLFIKIFKTII